MSLVTALVLLAAPAPARAGLTGLPGLVAVYDAILGARFSEVGPRLSEACPPAPEVACKALGVASLWWQILVNPDDRQLDGALTGAAADSIAAAEAWTRREPQSGEAWFYLAGSYAPLVQWRVWRGDRLAAARQGKKIKDALERAIQLDPSITDAYFGIGLYHYYADVAPPFAKFLRWLLLLPGGDRTAGLREMLRAREAGGLLSGEADYQLHQVYLWYERQTGTALALLEGLDARYPSNPVFLQRIADVQDTYLHDRRASASAWRVLIDRARNNLVSDPHTTEIRARLGLAKVLVGLNEIDEAIAELQIVIDLNPSSPPDARTRAEALLRDARARKNF